MSWYRAVNKHSIFVPFHSSTSHFFFILPCLRLTSTLCTYYSLDFLTLWDYTGLRQERHSWETKWYSNYQYTTTNFRWVYTAPVGWRPWCLLPSVLLTQSQRVQSCRPAALAASLMWKSHPTARAQRRLQGTGAAPHLRANTIMWNGNKMVMCYMSSLLSYWRGSQAQSLLLF